MSETLWGADHALEQPEDLLLAVCATRSPATPRTLLDILDATAATCPDAMALDDGRVALDYSSLLGKVAELAARLRTGGVGVGDRVGVRVSSGTAELYIAILAVLTAGAAYVPVDVDDPDERAELVWAEAGVCAVLTDHGQVSWRGDPGGLPDRPGPGDDAWIIFTSGSTGRPKGVAVTHRNAAAFVDAEARLFRAGPGDRVLAGLSVAFDASCEEMWLAWRNGACLVPAPRSLVKTGADLGKWLLRKQISVVSTVPTLAALWPVEALAGVRLLILGGEACPPELVSRLVDPGRQVWNTYGPTEATVVACATELHADQPVRIGLPLDGWQLAVVDPHGDEPVEWGEVGELVISGVGVARYLDPRKDAEKFVSLPTLGWDRAYRSGDLVRADPLGLIFVGRDDEQVKLGGRRIELGEIDAALLTLPGVAVAASAVQRTETGGQVLVGYVMLEDGVHEVDRDLLKHRLPAALMPLIAVVDDLPTRTSGKVDRKALPWPITVDVPVAEGWLAELWMKVLGVPVGEDADFFALGGASLAAAQLVTLVRQRCPALSVTDVYQYPTLAAMRSRVAELAAPEKTERKVRPVSRWAGVAQAAILLLLLTFSALRWLTVLATLNNVVTLFYGKETWAPTVSWPLVIAGWLVLITVPGRMVTTVAAVRLLTLRMRPGDYRRGGWAHLRLWTAERLVGMSGLAVIVGTRACTRFARALGCAVGDRVELHTMPPLTGLASFGDGCAVEPEADLTGWWLDGDVLRVGEITVGAGARVGTRSTLMPGAVIGEHAEVVPGSCVTGEHHAVGTDWRPARTSRSTRWNLAYTLSLQLLGALPFLSVLPGLVLTGLLLNGDGTLKQVLVNVLEVVVPATALSVLCYAGLVALLVRLAGRALKPGVYPSDGKVAWCAWLTGRLMTTARATLFPFYASMFTPQWLRLLGAEVGSRVEASTVLTAPGLLRVRDGAFLADDALLAPYELRGGWLRLGTAVVGTRAFVGNSGIVGVDHEVPDSALVGVLSTAPDSARPGSSWLGRPAIELPRTAEGVDATRTFDPPRRLVWARAAVELCRLLPVVLSAVLAELVVLSLEDIEIYDGLKWAAAVGGIVLLCVGAAACLLTTAAKWLLVGRFRREEHPLWSSFVWRNELADTFVEELAVPWLMRSAEGTPLLTAWLRSMGARIGRGVWCETHWLPEADLIEIGAGVSVNRGCVLQSHLFHDRLMRLDEVRIDEGATLGPHSIVLPGSTVGAATTVGAVSLVMRGETVPADSRWLGNPVSSWPQPD